MRHACRHNDDVARRDVDLDAAYGFLAVGGFGAAEDEAGFTLDDGWEL
jgi:hypothetical protein